MAKKEDPVDLQRQKEDIENLLSSLETAFSEGSITQEHYNEVKQKNLAKLEEIKKKLEKAEKPVQQETPEEEKEQKPESKKEETKKEEKKEEPLPKITESIDADKIKEKIIFELSPKIDKMNVKIEKIKAFVDALREEKAGERENIQRLMEEMGETRSIVSSMESRMSEMELKLEDVSETLADLKPQRFTKELQKKEEEIKMHEARIEKLDDMNSTLLKRINQIQIVLEKLGNIESIANMTKDLSKKIVSIDEKEKRITRLADKIDSMFVELNKRLEEFMFYKAKQDSLDDLSKEMLKSIDELTTKLTRYAEKDDLELLRDTLENKISTMMKEQGTTGIAFQRQQERAEIESLMKMLDEQFKKGIISKKDYEKAREANIKKLKELEKEQSYSPPMQETIVEQKQPEETIQEEDVGLAQASKIAQEPQQLSQNTLQEQEKREEIPAKEDKPEKPKEKPVAKTDRKQKPKEEKPAEVKTDKKSKMLSELEDSFRKGLISQKAYESARKILLAKKF
ncbi:MAG: hypothetical protein QW286_00340 [Candidatus Aenigmatarchaeota archaeon]